MDHNLITEFRTSISEKLDLKRNLTDEEITEIIEKSVLEKAKQIILSTSEKKEIVSTILIPLGDWIYFNPFWITPK